MKYLIIIFSLGLCLKALALEIGLSDIAPISYMDNGVLKGYNVEILKQLEKESGLKFKYNLYPHGRLTKLLDETNPDLLLIFSFVCTKYPDYEIQKKILYSLYPSIFTMKNSSLKKTELRIGRVIGTCNDLSKKFIKPENNHEVVNMSQAFQMMKSGRLDGVCANELVLIYNLKNNKELKKQLFKYQTERDEQHKFDAVICRKKNLSAVIKNKLDKAASNLVIPQIKNYQKLKIDKSYTSNS